MMEEWLRDSLVTFLSVVDFVGGFNGDILDCGLRGKGWGFTDDFSDCG